MPGVDPEHAMEAMSNEAVSRTEMPRKARRARTRSPEAHAAHSTTASELVSSSRPGDRAAIHEVPPPAGGSLAFGEASLPSGDPLSTRALSGEDPWTVVPSGPAYYAADVLPDSDLTR